LAVTIIHSPENLKSLTDATADPNEPAGSEGRPWSIGRHPEGAVKKSSKDSSVGKSQLPDDESVDKPHSENADTPLEDRIQAILTKRMVGDDRRIESVYCWFR